MSDEEKRGPGRPPKVAPVELAEPTVKAVVMRDVAKKARDWSAAADAIDTGGDLKPAFWRDTSKNDHPRRRLDAGR